MLPKKKNSRRNEATSRLQHIYFSWLEKSLFDSDIEIWMQREYVLSNNKIMKRNITFSKVYKKWEEKKNTLKVVR